MWTEQPRRTPVSEIPVTRPLKRARINSREAFNSNLVGNILGQSRLFCAAAESNRMIPVNRGRPLRVSTNKGNFQQ